MRYVLTLVIALSLGVGACTAVAVGDEAVALAPQPDAGVQCDFGTGITQEAAAKTIGETYCATINEGPACVAKLVDFYCPSHVSCNGLVCTTDSTYLKCISAVPTGECRNLFPTVPPLEEPDHVLTLSAAAYVADATTTVIRSNNPVSVGAVAAGDFQITLPLLMGDRIKSVAITHRGNGDADITTYGVARTTAKGLTAGLGFAAVIDPGPGWDSTTLDLVDTVKRDGDSFTLHVGAVNMAPIQLGNVTVVYDRPSP